MYWPSKQTKSEVHGALMVTYLDEESFAHYTVRRFEVKPVDHCSHYSQVSVVWYQYIAICHHVDLMFLKKNNNKKQKIWLPLYMI